MPEKPTVEAGTHTERDPLALVRSAETHLFQAKQALENLGTESTNSELIESSTKLGAQFEELDAALTAKRQAVYTSLLESVIALKVEMPISYKHGYAPQYIKPNGGIYYRNGDVIVSSGEVGGNSFHWREACTELVRAIQEFVVRSKRLDSDTKELGALKTSLEKLIADMA